MLMISWLPSWGPRQPCMVRCPVSLIALTHRIAPCIFVTASQLGMMLWFHRGAHGPTPSLTRHVPSTPLLQWSTADANLNGGYGMEPPLTPSPKPATPVAADTPAGGGRFFDRTPPVVPVEPAAPQDGVWLR